MVRWCLPLLILWSGCSQLWAQTEMRDPTRPLKYSAPISSQQQQALKLHSVLISSQRKLAVINGKTVRENQWVDGARVVSILPGKVLLSVRGRQQELRLKAKVRN